MRIEELEDKSGVEVAGRGLLHLYGQRPGPYGQRSAACLAVPRGCGEPEQDRETESGWKVKPQADLSVVPPQAY